MKIQIAREFFLCSLTIMKSVLSLAEFRMGKQSEEYVYFKKQVMDYFYNNLFQLFEKLQNNKVLMKCSCQSKLRKGYNKCEFCGGSGYRNIDPQK